MATPQMIIQSGSKVLIPGSPGSLRINTFNPDGTVLDVHTGYTVGINRAFPQSNPNPGLGAQDVSSQMSAAFDTTGLTLSWTGTQATNMVNSILTSMQNAHAVALSNDSGTTQSFCYQGSLAIDGNAQFL